MARYRKKPVVIEAVQWTGNMTEIIGLVGHDLPTYGDGRNHSLRVTTLEGDMECRLGDYLIRGIQGEIYPCKADIFMATYEAVD